MDPAEEIELHALRLQKPMNEVIDAGNSNVQEFYRGATVFVSGGTGFLGKQLIEKLFRSCAIKKMYLLMRSKKGRTMQERLQLMLKDPVYDMLRQKQPQFADLIVPVEGDVAELGLGMKEENWRMISEEVTLIFHVAATVRFDEPLRVATLTNLRGTREMLLIAKDCVHLKKFVYVSTAFTHATKSRVDTEVLEQFYPTPVPPELMIRLAEDVNEKRLDAITPDLIEDWPNTYTFTKALAEEYLRTSAGDTPVCIVRPSIVIPAYYEPGPGWLDVSAIAGPSGLCLATILGVLHVICLDKTGKLPMIPVDYVNNAIIAAAWDTPPSLNNNKADIPIYTIKKPIALDSITATMRKEESKLNPPDAVWRNGGLILKNKYLCFVLSLLLHYIPAYALDIVTKIVGKKPKQISSFVGAYRKIDKLILVYNYFMNNQWDFKDSNLSGMVDRMSAADKAIFNCDVKTIDIYEYIQVWTIGIRKYIIKDGLKNTAKAFRNQRILMIVNYICLALYGYILWFIACSVLFIIKYIIAIFLY